MACPATVVWLATLFTSISGEAPCVTQGQATAATQNADAPRARTDMEPPPREGTHKRHRGGPFRIASTLRRRGGGRNRYALIRAFPGSYRGLSDATAGYDRPAISTSHCPPSSQAASIGEAASIIARPIAPPSVWPYDAART